MRFAIINNKTIENIIDADDMFAVELRKTNTHVIDVTSKTVAIGDSYDGIKFTAQKQPKIVRIKAVKIITKIAFMNLFTDAELIAIYDAAKLSTALHVWIKKLEASTDVKLSSPTTVAGVKALEAAGLIAVGRAAVILK